MKACVSSITPLILISSVLLVTSGSTKADVIAEVIAGNGDLSAVFRHINSGPDPLAASATLNEYNPAGSTTMSGNVGVGQTPLAGGGRTVRFRMDGRLMVAELFTQSRRVDSKATWKDTLYAPPGAVGDYKLRFRIDGTVYVAGSVTGLPERWKFEALQGSTLVDATGVHDPLTFGTLFPSSTQHGWKNFRDLGNGRFDGMFEIPIAANTPFDLQFRSELYAHDIETLVEADLGHTITLDSILDSSNQVVNNALFTSGLSFSSASAAVPEPSSLAAVGFLFAGVACRRFRKKASAMDER